MLMTDCTQCISGCLTEVERMYNVYLSKLTLKLWETCYNVKAKFFFRPRIIIFSEVLSYWRHRISLFVILNVLKKPSNFGAHSAYFKGLYYLYMYQRTFLNAFNVRQRVTSPLFHTSSYYLKDWIEQGAYLGIYQYNNTCFACS